MFITTDTREVWALYWSHFRPLLLASLLLITFNILSIHLTMWTAETRTPCCYLFFCHRYWIDKRCRNFLLTFCPLILAKSNKNLSVTQKHSDPPYKDGDERLERWSVLYSEQETSRPAMWMRILPALHFSLWLFSDDFMCGYRDEAVSSFMWYVRLPAADTCRSWWTRAHEGLAVCGSSHTATEPG